jgi:hypothetical protein
MRPAAAASRSRRSISVCSATGETTVFQERGRQMVGTCEGGLGRGFNVGIGGAGQQANSIGS